MAGCYRIVRQVSMSVVHGQLHAAEHNPCALSRHNVGHLQRLSVPVGGLRRQPAVPAHPCHRHTDT